MGRQWGPSLRVAEQAGCVVSASRAGQPDAGSWSCSGVILSRSPGLVLCHGGIFTPFLRTGSAALTQTGAAFLPGDSCSDDLRLHVQWGPTAASPAGRADQELPGLCTPQCASLGLEPGAPSRARARPLQPPRPAQLLLLLSCPAFRSHFARLFGAEAADQWHFVSSAPDDAVSEEEEEDQLRALGWFALLRVQRGAAAEERRGPAVTVAPLGAVAKGAPLLACGSPFGAFCPDIFLNTLSRGVLSNAAGPLLLTDARCLPGTEGGGVFAARPAGALVALVAAPLCWKAREWVGLTLLCAAAPLLQVARSALSRLHPDSTSLSALLPPEVGAPRGLSLRDLGSSWAAAAVLVECGAVWGSGVAVAPRLVVTCRHVAPRETARVLVHSATPRNVAIWGRVVFATQETSPYDIAVVSLEEELNGVPVPVPAEHFHEGEPVSVVGFGVFGQACGPSVTSGILSAVVHVDDAPVMLQTTCAVHGGSSGGPLFSTRSGDLLGIVASNTRDNNTGATYPHLNFSIPITVLQPALKQYSQTGDLCGLRELDHTTEPVRVVWRLQRPLPEAPRSKL
ncbi:trypsin domain containing 1 (predicted), isoform CRA_a [Rattus norvegicus]|uniref:Peroxisomal leader peptide-processing protease n=2 Tax=Rattus norvegicus TaxID=10116 RepID=F7FC90_RAT|nr:peroxisomal leader peptide-processing protease [Rattus norvegicus]AAI60877.1 Trypsin domain containing 1 [Rattus norvegicus]EDL93006.1 trypsin domain containing 1 (predicted), isoform CRA_a [Rattus norvegicus]|eukprot:NP_001102402.1 peroxisomal leader peptide-processing protease [Rattus norvegicus]